MGGFAIVSSNQRHRQTLYTIVHLTSRFWRGNINIIIRLGMYKFYFFILLAVTFPGSFFRNTFVVVVVFFRILFWKFFVVVHFIFSYFLQGFWILNFFLFCF